MCRTTTVAILLLMLGCAVCFGQSPFKGLQPGRSTRSDVERVLGQPVRNVSETLSEYKSDKEREMIFVQYRRGSTVVERVEVVYLDALERSTVIKALRLPQQPAASQTNSKGRLEEYFARPQHLVLTYAGAEKSSGVSRVGYYSRELYESAVAKVGQGPGASSEQPDTLVGGNDTPAPTLGPDREGWGFNEETATVLGYFGSPSAAACRADCEKNPRCKAFSWIKPGGYQAGDPPMCYLMSSWTKLVRHPCCISAVKNPH